MKQRNVFRMSIFGKLFLVVALFVGGGNAAWAGDVLTLTFEGNEIPSGWTLSNYAFDNGYLKADKTWNTMNLISQSPYSIENGQKIVITAKGLNTTLAKVSIFFSTDGSTASFSSSPNKEFTSELRVDKDNDYVLTYVNATDRTCFLKFAAYYAAIKKIEIQPTLSELNVIDEDVNPGEFKNSTPASISVKYTPSAGWNTICMPIQLRTYGVNYLQTIFGSDLKSFSLSNYSDGIITFSPIAASGYINANTPLLVFAPNATGQQKQFDISNMSVTYSESPKVTAGTASFQGTYATKSYQEGDDWYGVTSDGKVMQAGEGAYVKGYRAYFTGISAPANGARPTIVLVDDGGLTDVGFVKMIDQEAKDVYTLSGQKVEKAGRGIYVVNGRKVVIK